MNKFKHFTLTGLALLMIGGSIMPVKAKSNHQRIESSRNIHHSSLIQRAVRDGYYDFKQQIEDGEDSDYGYLLKHPTLFKNKSYRGTYVQEITKLSKKYDDDISKSDGIKSTSATDTIRDFQNMWPKYNRMTPKEQKAFRLSVKLTANLEAIPKNDRNSLKFAKIYLMGNYYQKDVSGTGNKGRADCLSDYYHVGHGKISLQHLAGQKLTNVFKIANRLSRKIAYNADTTKQVKQLNKSALTHNHLTKYYQRQLKAIINNNDENPVPDKLFAKNIYCKYPFHQLYYYSKNIPGGKENGEFQGTIIGLHNNKATYQTVNNYRKYLNSYMMHVGEKESYMHVNPKYKRFESYWHHNYSIRHLKGDNRTDNPGNNWYSIKYKIGRNNQILYITENCTPDEIAIKD